MSSGRPVSLEFGWYGAGGDGVEVTHSNNTLGPTQCARCISMAQDRY